MTEQFETPKEFMDKFIRNKYSKMETILAKVLEENPDVPITDFEIAYDTNQKPVAIYKKVKVYDFKEDDKEIDIEIAKKIAEDFSKEMRYYPYPNNKRSPEEILKRRAMNCTDGFYTEDEIEYRNKLVEKYKKIENKDQ